MRTWGQVPLLRVGMEYTSKRPEGISLVCLNVIMSQLGEQKGNLWQGPALHLVTWARRSQPVCRDVEATEKYEVRRIYNTVIL